MIYVIASVNRKKILQHLQNESEYISTSELAKAINVSRGTINPHCKGLAQRGLIYRKSVKGVRGMRMKITEKGIKAVEQINRRKRFKERESGEKGARGILKRGVDNQRR